MKRFTLLIAAAFLVLLSFGYAFAATCDAAYSSSTILLPDQDMNQGITIQVRNIDFSSLGVELADLNDVRVFDENSGCEELERICDGTSSSVDGNCFFRLTNSFTKGGSGRNSTYFLYHDNAAAGEPPDENVARTSVCGWEAGEECHLLTNDSLGNTTTDWNRFGLVGYELDASESIVRYDSLGSRPDLNYTVWFLDWDGQSTGVTMRLELSTPGQEVCKMFVNNGDVKIGTVTTLYAHTAATWYQGIISYADGDSTCYYALKDVYGNILATASGGTIDGNDGLIARVVSTVNVGENEIYLDNRFLSAPVLALGLCPSATCDLNMTIEFRDENSHTPLVGLSVDINGASYTTDGSGQVGFPIGDVRAEESVVVRAWDDANYGSRYFEFDVNSIDGIDVNVLMLLDVNGLDVNFQFYQTDASTLLANTKLWVYDEDNNLVSIDRTDSVGKVDFFLGLDSNIVDHNYYFVTASGTRYYKVKVTFKRPLDEENLGVVTPFDLDISTLARKSFAAKSADLVFYALPNTISRYRFDLNGGATYYPRKFEVNYKGNPATATLQMYLPKVVEGVLSVFFTKDAIDLTVEPGILIRVFKDIVGAGTVEVQSVITDAAGTATMAFVLDDEYRFDFYDTDIAFLFSKTLRPNFSAYYVYIDTGAIEWTEPSVEYITIQGLPTVGSVLFSDQGYDVNVTIEANNGTIATSWLTVANDDGNVSFNTNCGSGCGYTIEIKDMNNTRDVRVTVFVETASGLKLSKTWTFIPSDASVENWIDILKGSAFREEWGCSADPNEPCFFLLMVAAFITIGMVVAAGAGLTADRSAIGIVALFGMGIFTFLNWIPVGIFIIGCLAVFGGLVLARRVF